MPTIYKYPLALSDVQYIVMPCGARPLYATEQRGWIVVYALVDASLNTFTRRKVWIVGTGQPYSADADALPLGVVALQGGDLMFHVFVGPELPTAAREEPPA